MNIAVITACDDFGSHTDLAFAELGIEDQLDVSPLAHHEIAPHTAPRPPRHELVTEIRLRARAFLAQNRQRFALQLRRYSSLRSWMESLQRDDDVTANGLWMVYLDDRYLSSSPREQTLTEHLVRFIRDPHSLAPASLRIPNAVVAYSHISDNEIWSESPIVIRHMPEQRWVFTSEIICSCMDYLGYIAFNKRLLRNLDRPQPLATLATELTNFLCDRAGNDWLFLSYTGSVVSTLIQSVMTIAQKKQVPCLRGPNEHSLACSAMANWQLYRRPFLITVTNAMLDEFKGTLANLREANAKGIIVCGECRDGHWFPFQGTINADEDSRAVLTARDIPYVYLDSADTLAADLRQAYDAYESARGPVVLLVTANVLQLSGPLKEPIPYPRSTPAPPPSQAQTKPDNARRCQQTEQALAAVMDMINRRPMRLLWQMGHMSNEAVRLVHTIAKRGGIALADSLTRPGTVTKFVDGQLNENYLGVLGIYGFSARIHRYLHTAGKLNHKDEQCIFFLQSKLTQAATPFTAAKCTKVQLTHNPNHMCPSTEYPLHMDLLPFLHYVDRHLDVDPEVLRFRRQLLRSIPHSTSDVISRIPSSPMSHNYFFYRLNQVIEDLICNHGYRYTGVYDVGRASASAIRNVTRTGPGFSGWYGRALMGDALMAVPSLAMAGKNNIVAFIGDGAKALVPDILPTILEAEAEGRTPIVHNVTVFYLLNGSHSMIRSYQELVRGNLTSRQMSIVSRLTPDHDWHCGDLEITHKTLESFDADYLHRALKKPRCINFLSVLLSHNSEGDGLSLITERQWQRDHQLDEYTP